jgi:hypothetical protein
MSCKDKISDRCLKKTNAVCVKYEGTLSGNSDLDAQDCHTVEAVIEDINEQLDDIYDQIDLSGIDESCIDFQEEEAGKVKVREAIIALTLKLKDVMEHVGMSCDDCPECESSCNPIFTEDISCLNLDYKCLADACGVQPTNLKELLQLIIDSVCAEDANPSPNPA